MYLPLFVCVIEIYERKNDMWSSSKCCNRPSKIVSFKKRLQELSQFISTFSVLPLSISRLSLGGESDLRGSVGQFGGRNPEGQTGAPKHAGHVRRRPAI